MNSTQTFRTRNQNSRAKNPTEKESSKVLHWATSVYLQKYNIGPIYIMFSFPGKLKGFCFPFILRHRHIDLPLDDFRWLWSDASLTYACF